MKTISIRIFGSALTLLFMGTLLSMTQCTELNGLEDPAELEQQLTGDEIEGILYLREEEKLARDVYQYLYEIFPLRPFLNISKSEQAHMDAIKYLIDTYELEDPVGDNAAGIFQNKELQQLYDDLIQMGSTSREEALKVGALIEEVDIIDLRTELENHAENEDVIRVFENLCEASERHLKAFVGVLVLYDVNYRPVKLDNEEFDRIIAGPPASD